MRTIERKFPANARAVLAAAAAPVLAACTLVSGWGDLQGGTRAAGDGGSPDAASSSGGVADAARDAGGSCAAKCAPLVCCVSVVSHQTSCATSCGTNSTTWELDCGSSADCDGGQCCLDIGSGRFVASCAPTCAPGSEIVCDPNDPSSCPSPQVCNGQLGTSICQ